MSDCRPIRVLAIFEGTKITGPAKNLLQYGRLARAEAHPYRGAPGERPPVELMLTVFWRPNDPPTFADAAREAGIELHKIPERARFDRSVIPALQQLTRQVQPDIVQSHGVKGHFLVRYGGLNRIAPWVAFQHGYTTTDIRTRLYNQLDRWSLPGADQVVTMNQPFRQALIGTGVKPERIAVIHNAIEPDWGRRNRTPEQAAQLRAKYGIPASRQVVMIVARLSREKDHVTLVRAVHQILTRAPELDPHVLIVGEGPERARIEEATKVLAGMEERVTITGWAPSEPFYGVADVAVLSSLSEGSPNALLEALAAGVPAVATKVGGIPEIIEDRKTGLLVDTQNVSQMRDAIHTLLKNRNLADLIVREGLARAADYSPLQRVANIGRIYQQVLAGKMARKSR